MNRISSIISGTAISLCMLSTVTGCGKKAPPAPAGPTYTQAAIQAGGTLNSDGSVTNPNGTITQPNGTVLPGNSSAAIPQATPPASETSSAATNPPSSTSASVPAPPASTVRTAPAGTAVTIRTTQELSASRDGVGTRFNAVLESPVSSHGQVIFPRGTPVSGEVVASKRKGEFKGAGELAIVLTTIGREPVRTSEYVQVDKGRGKRTGAFIGGGGGLGALIGGLAGGGKGALIGGLAGAGAGTAASTTGSKNVIIHPETVITFRLRAPVSH